MAELLEAVCTSVMREETMGRTNLAVESQASFQHQISSRFDRLLECLHEAERCKRRELRDRRVADEAETATLVTDADDITSEQSALVGGPTPMDGHRRGHAPIGAASTATMTHIPRRRPLPCIVYPPVAICGTDEYELMLRSDWDEIWFAVWPSEDAEMASMNDVAQSRGDSKQRGSAAAVTAPSRLRLTRLASVATEMSRINLKRLAMNELSEEQLEEQKRVVCLRTSNGVWLRPLRKTMLAEREDRDEIFGDRKTAHVDNARGTMVTSDSDTVGSGSEPQVVLTSQHIIRDLRHLAALLALAIADRDRVVTPRQRRVRRELESITARRNTDGVVEISPGGIGVTTSGSSPFDAEASIEKQPRNTAVDRDAPEVRAVGVDAARRIFDSRHIFQLGVVYDNEAALRDALTVSCFSEREAMRLDVHSNSFERQLRAELEHAEAVARETMARAHYHTSIGLYLAVILERTTADETQTRMNHVMEERAARNFVRLQFDQGPDPEVKRLHDRLAAAEEAELERKLKLREANAAMERGIAHAERVQSMLQTAMRHRDHLQFRRIYAGQRRMLEEQESAVRSLFQDHFWEIWMMELRDSMLLRFECCTRLILEKEELVAREWWTRRGMASASWREVSSLRNESLQRPNRRGISAAARRAALDNNDDGPFLIEAARERSEWADAWLESSVAAAAGRAGSAAAQDRRSEPRYSIGRESIVSSDASPSTKGAAPLPVHQWPNASDDWATPLASAAGRLASMCEKLQGAASR